MIDWGEAIAKFRADSGQDALLVQATRRYRRTDDEVAVAQQVVRVARGLGRTQAMVLLQSAASSVSSLEGSLVRWVEDPDRPPDHRRPLEELLEQVEQLRTDSRLDCFNGLVEELIGRGARHVVVFCEYRSTQEYLGAAIERLDFPDYQLHGALDAARRAEVLERFTNDGGLLITTTASEGVSLNFVDAVIHYDLPFTPAAFAQREGRYHRYSRRQRCPVYFLDDETHALPLEGLQLRMAQEINLISEEEVVDMDDLLRAALEQGREKET